MPGPDKIICSRPNRKYERAPQKKSADGVHADCEIIIMEKQGNDGCYLKTCFILSQPGGGHVPTGFGNDVSETCNSQFPPDDNTNHPCRHPSVVYQHDKGRRYQQFIRDRIHDLTETGNQALLTCEIAIQIIGYGGGAEKKSGDKCANSIREIH